MTTRGRPKSFCPDRALENAMQLFWQRGYEAASLQDLQAAKRRAVAVRAIPHPEFGCGNLVDLDRSAIADEQHVVVAHIASPVTARNIRQQPQVCLSFVDVFVQKGFKLVGTAHELQVENPAFAAWAAPLLAMVGQRFVIHSVLVIRVSSVASIVAPSYRFYPDETTEASQVASAMKAYKVHPAPQEKP